MSQPISSNVESSTSARRWRWTALWVLTAINLLNYIDRFIFSALAPALQRDLGFSDTQIGLLGSAFIVAYTLVAPLCGWLGDLGSRSRVMSIGVALWSMATAFSGLARTFSGQFMTRMLVGLGESAYSVIAPSTIGDHFPKASRGKIFAIYSGALPVGTALGYILGEQLEKAVGWQKAFFFVGTPGLICAALLFFLRDPERGEADAATSSIVTASGSTAVVGETTTAHPARRPWAHFFSTCGKLFKNGGFMSVVLGYAAYTFVLGGMAYWMPIYITRYFHVENGIAKFGLVTVIGGFVGTFLGGWWADRIERRSGNGFLKVCIWSIVLAVPLFAFVLAVDDFRTFMILLFFVEVALFLCMSPLDAVVISYVRPSMRATAMAVNIFLIHALGDGISRTLIGSMSDATDLRAALAICPPVLALAGVIWFVGLILYWQPLAWPKSAPQFPMFQAHRGYWKPTQLQENTLAAFRAARARGAEMVELDVQLAGDGQVVVFHDKDLKRIANTDRQVFQVTATEIEKLANAPRLEDVLRDPEVTRILNVELKTREIFKGDLEREVARVVALTGSQNRVVFSSFNPFSLRRLSKHLPDVPRALLVTEERGGFNRIWLRRMWLGAFARVHLLHLGQDMISHQRVQSWADRGLAVVVWTVNDPETARRFLDWNVRGIISDELLDVGAKPQRLEA